MHERFYKIVNYLSSKFKVSLIGLGKACCAIVHVASFSNLIRHIINITIISCEFEM